MPRFNSVVRQTSLRDSWKSAQTVIALFLAACGAFADLHARPAFKPRIFGLACGRSDSIIAATHGSTAESAKAAFERFKSLAGKWVGRSTKGWEEAVSFKTIARGSVVVENSFDAHPNETMMTMFHLDGGRLLLTHYCVAGSQPRLQATAFEETGKTITFTFLDATNLKSRDQGHMDKAVFRFADENHFTVRWTWYQNGKENWMEEIIMKRQPD